MAMVIAACGLEQPGPGVAVVVPSTVADDQSMGIDPALEQAVDAPADAGVDPSLPATSVATGPEREVRSPGSRRPTVADLPDTVAVVGDSLTESAVAEITDMFEGVGIDVLVVDGAQNRRMTHGNLPLPGTVSIDEIAAHAAPDVWVIALGTNDVGSEQSPAQFRADAQSLLSHVPAGAPLVWVDLWIRDRQPAIEAANAELRDVIERRPDSIVADWYSHGDDHGLVTADGVHLTDDGRNVFAIVMVDAVYDLFA